MVSFQNVIIQYEDEWVIKDVLHTHTLTPTSTNTHTHDVGISSNGLSKPEDGITSANDQKSAMIFHFLGLITSYS